MSHFAATKPHGALDLVALSKELDYALAFDFVVASADLRPELDFFDDRSCLVFSGFAGLDRLVVFVLAIVHHPYDGWACVRCDLNEVQAELCGEPSSFIDVLLADLAAIWRNEPHSLYANFVIYPWFRDGLPPDSWSCVQEVPTQNNTARNALLKVQPIAPESVERWEAGASSCVICAAERSTNDVLRRTQRTQRRRCSDCGSGRFSSLVVQSWLGSSNCIFGLARCKNAKGHRNACV